jgi:hypothetical protein
MLNLVVEEQVLEDFQCQDKMGWRAAILANVTRVKT